MIGYNSQEDAIMRVDRTLLMYKGEPHYVRIYHENPLNQARLSSIKQLNPGGRTPKGITVDLTSDDVSCTFPRIGYMNYNDTAWYLQRSPVRTQRQGLSGASVTTPPGLYEINNLLFSHYGYDMLMGNFPSQEAALAKVRHEFWQSCAFSKDFAIKRLDNTETIGLLYRDTIRAIYDDMMGMFVAVGNTRDKSYFVNKANEAGVRLAL